MTQETTSGSQHQLAMLLAALTSAEERLRQRGDDHWADWLAGDRARIAHGDAYGLEHLKQAFGGMGSINDTYPSDDGGVGDTLSQIYRSAAQLLADRQRRVDG